jgi:hypothetical protein
MPEMLMATSPGAAYQDWDLMLMQNKSAMNSRVKKYDILTNNLSKMLSSVNNLFMDPSFQPLFGPQELELASRLSWLMLYFYGALTHFALWIVAQSAAKTVAQQGDILWIDFMKSLTNLWNVLDNLPVNWLAQGSNALRPSTQQKQWIPAEAPLALVTQIYLLVHDRRKPLRSPGKIMALLIFFSNLAQNIARVHISVDDVEATLRLLALNNRFPKTGKHDGFSSCIFVARSDAPDRKIVVGSTGMDLRYLNVSAIETSFMNLRKRRFTQGANRYDMELKERFNNESDTARTSPLGRYTAVGYTRNTTGTEYASLASLVRRQLVDECAGRQPVPGANHPVLRRKKWAPFSYPKLHGRAHFGPIMFANQRSWFEPTPRCLKCRVIHDYEIVGEDLQVTATPNKSCQCAEDIVYAKLRQLGRVGNVVLDDL